MRIQGNKTESFSVKEKGELLRHNATHAGSDKMAEHADGCGNLVQVGFEAGRTIELKRFEFCRVRLGIRGRVPAGVDADEIRLASEAFILEMLGREEAAVSGAKTTIEWKIDHSILESLAKAKCRCVSVTYGLTLKSGQREFESHQVDLIQEMPVSDGADILVAFNALADEMAAHLDKQHKRIKGINGTGL